MNDLHKALQIAGIKTQLSESEALARNFKYTSKIQKVLQQLGPNADRMEKISEVSDIVAEAFALLLYTLKDIEHNHIQGRASAEFDNRIEELRKIMSEVPSILRKSFKD